MGFFNPSFGARFVSISSATDLSVGLHRWFRGCSPHRRSRPERASEAVLESLGVAQCWKVRSRECRRWGLKGEKESGDASFAFCFFFFSPPALPGHFREPFPTVTRRGPNRAVFLPFFFNPSFETRRFLSSDKDEKNVPPWVLAEIDTSDFLHIPHPRISSPFFLFPPVP